MFRANGSKFGEEFLVNTTTAGNQFNPQVTTLTDGGFVVTWDDPSNAGADKSLSGIRGQKFTANGAKSGSEIQINATTTNNQALSAVTALSGGRFAVAWADDSQTGDDASGYAIRAQVFNANGSRSGGETLVNTTSFEWQYDPAITTLADGRFVIAWTDYSTSGKDTSGLAVRAQVFNDDGSKSGTEFLVNTITAGWQLEQTLTALPDGRFVVAWTDSSTTGGDSSPSGIRGQIFDPRLAAVDLAGTSGADSYYGTRFADTLKGAEGGDTLDGASGNDSISGDDGADTLTGGGGNDSLDGGAGADTLAGGTGDDSYVVDDLADVIAESAREGNDTVLSAQISLVLTAYANIENATLNGMADLDLTGNNRNNVLRGNEGANIIDAGGGNDRIISGGGDDVMTGGKGTDRFIFAPQEGSSAVTDFEVGNDRIDLTGFGFANVAAVRAFGANGSGGVVFTFAGGSVLTIENVTRAQLTADDFIL